MPVLDKGNNRIVHLGEIDEELEAELFASGAVRDPLWGGPKKKVSN
jgi:hypothetical protein